MADYLLPVANEKYHSLWIEFKANRNKQTVIQKQFQELMEECGNKYVICHDLDEAIEELRLYLLED